MRNRFWASLIVAILVVGCGGSAKQGGDAVLRVYASLPLRGSTGADGRDAVWSHPDLVPTSADLDDPLGFAAGEATAQTSGDDDFDAALAELLDEAERPQGDEKDGDQDGRPEGDQEGDGPAPTR